MVNELETQLEEQDTDFDTIIERIMQIESERFELAQQTNNEKIEHANEILARSKAREVELGKKLRRAEKMIEVSQKSGSNKQVVVDNKSSVKMKNEQRQDRSKDSEASISQERASVQSSNLVKKSVTTSNGPKMKGSRFN